MKKIGCLILLVIFLMVCACSSTGNDNDSNTTPFEGIWKVLLGNFTFKGNLVSLTSYAYPTESYSNRAFSYDETTKKLIIVNTDTTFFLVKNNQLILGKFDSEGDFCILSLQKSTANSISSSRIVSVNDGINLSSKVVFSPDYSDKDLNLDSLKYFYLQPLEFVSYKDTNRGVSISIKDPTEFIGKNLNEEFLISSSNNFDICLQGYNSSYVSVGSEIRWTISKFKIKSYSYDPTTSLNAVFYDLKNYAGTTLLDTLELKIDLSNVEAFKTMMKGLQ